MQGTARSGRWRSWRRATRASPRPRSSLPRPGSTGRSASSANCMPPGGGSTNNPAGRQPEGTPDVDSPRGEDSIQLVMPSDQDRARHSDSLTDDGRYRLLVEQVFDYAIYMLDPSGIVTSWNRGA